MGYVVVQFIKWKSGNSVQAVPESWVVKVAGRQMCYFPKNNAVKMIEEQASAKANWNSFEVRILSTKPIKSYDKALKKETNAKFTSGIDSDDEEPEIKQPTKRRILGNKEAEESEMKNPTKRRILGNKENVYAGMYEWPTVYN